jgi:hypothetical protein
VIAFYRSLRREFTPPLAQHVSIRFALETIENSLSQPSGIVDRYQLAVAPIFQNLSRTAGAIGTHHRATFQQRLYQYVAKSLEV